MTARRTMMIAGCIVDFDFDALALRQGISPVPFYEPGMGEARTLTMKLDSGYEAVVVQLALLPQLVQVMLEYRDDALHAADIDSLMHDLDLAPARFERVQGQTRWREAPAIR